MCSFMRITFCHRRALPDRSKKICNSPIISARTVTGRILRLMCIANALSPFHSSIETFYSKLASREFTFYFINEHSSPYKSPPHETSFDLQERCQFVFYAFNRISRPVKFLENNKFVSMGF